MELSPFPHQGPLEPSEVRGREDLIADLTERVTSRRVTALLGPRRFGKTSVLRRLGADLASCGTSVVWVDLYEVTSVADLARRFDSALATAQGDVKSRLDSLSARFNLQLGLLGVELARRRDERPDAEASLDARLDALVATGRATPTVVMIDEFPGIDRVDGAAGLLRTKFQHHFQDIGLVFAGSQPSLMRTMFADRARPFYAQADLVEIGALSVAAVHDVVTDGFTTTGRDPGALPELIYQFTAGHPYRTMHVADVAWRTLKPGSPFTDGNWGRTLEVLRAETSMASEAVFSGMTVGEKSTLRLLAHGQPLYGSTAGLMNLSGGSARHALQSLIDAGDVENNGSRATIVDPVLADWVRRRFPL